MRLCTFTKLVSKISHILTSHDFGVESCCVEYSLWILHVYFREFGVAFHDGELAEGDNVFTAWKKRTVTEVRELKKKAKESRQKSKEATKEQRRSQLPVWELFTSQQIEELEQDNQEDTVTQLEIGAIARIETKLSHESVKAVLLGSRWIQLADLFRWCREGRFGISVTQLNALEFATSWKEELETNKFAKRTKIFYEAIRPSSESLRVLAFLTQFTGIPQNMQSLEFSKVLSRLISTLSLPKVFLQHLDMKAN